MRIPNLELIIAQQELEITRDEDSFLRGLVALLMYLNNYQTKSIDYATIKYICFDDSLYEEICHRYLIEHGDPFLMPTVPNGVVCFYPAKEIKEIAVQMLHELDIQV